MWRKTANSREEMPEYVERSYHEALVNGLGHRDYLIYGSGFGKIISGYEFKKNYTDNKKPTFRSDRYQFTVIMPNLNYGTQDVHQGVPQDVPQGVPQDVPQDHLDVQILELMRANDKISTESIAKTLGVSSKTIKRRIKEMDNVRYIGSGYSGHWGIIE